jgi:phosphatidylethanolamine/phosphatidyl-N-methylethanolamine N-methyltransferase
MEGVKGYAWDTYMFLKSWFSSPKQMGTMFPSTKKTGKKIAGLIKDAEHVLVVELGAGTGQVTERILEDGVRPENFVAVEYDRGFCEELYKKYPAGPAILNIDAANVLEHLPSRFIGQTDYLISTLPLLTLGPEKAKEIVEAIFKVLKPNGVYIQVTLSMFQPKYVKVLGLRATRLCISWMNIPPMHIWRICKPEQH